GLESEHRVTAAVIELDALADTIRPAAEDDDLLLVGRVSLAGVFEAAVEIRRERLELRRAGIDALVGGLEPQLLPFLADRSLVDAQDAGELAIAKARALERAHQVVRHV